MRIWSILFLHCLFLTSILIAQQSAEELYQSALYAEEVEGNLNDAIKIYKKIISDFSENRPITAKALIQMGKCYEKLGDAEAKKAYSQVINDFSEQLQQVSEARVRLSALRKSSEKVTESGISMQKICSVTLDIGDKSPDGRYFVYSNWDTGNKGLYDLESGKKFDITKDGKWGEFISEWGEWSAFSRNGNKIAYIWYKSVKGDKKLEIDELRIIGIDGSNQRTVFPGNGRFPQPKEWTKNGKQILTLLHGENHQISLISVQDGEEKTLKDLYWKEPGGIVLSPDDKYIIYDCPVEKDSPRRDIYLISSDGKYENTIIENPSRDFRPHWLPDGKGIMFMSDRSGNTGLWYQAISNGKSKGDPKLIKDNLNRMWFFGISTDNKIFLEEKGIFGDIFKFSIEPETGKVIKPVSNAATSNLGYNNMAQYTRDGKYLIYLSGDRNNLKIENLENGESRELKTSVKSGMWSAPFRLSHDEKSIVCFGWNFEGNQGLFDVDLSTGKAKRLPRLAGDNYKGFECSNDENKFYLVQDKGESGTSVLIYDISTQSSEIIYHTEVGGYKLNRPAKSQDGKKLACYDRDGIIVIIPTSGGDPEILQMPEAENNRISSIAWSHDGKYLYFTKRLGKPEVTTGEIWRVHLTSGEFQNLGISVEHNIGYLTIHPNGKDIVFTLSYFYSPNHIWVLENYLQSLEDKM
ncbi:tetratricopeptide repeat protein [Bacteroidota bacterium]